MEELASYDSRLVVGVLGCMAQEHKQYMLARMPHVDLVVGPSAFGDIDVGVDGVVLDDGGQDGGLAGADARAAGTGGVGHKL